MRRREFDEACRRHARRALVTTTVATALGVVAMAGTPADAAPALFWVSEPVRPGEVALVYGGDLKGVREVWVQRVSDDDPGVPPPTPAVVTGTAVKVLQPSEGSFKFEVPATMSEGVFAMTLGGRPRLINVPKVEWIQPTRLLPGMSANEAAPGATVQIIGRNFVLHDSNRGRVKAVLRQHDGRVIPVSVIQADAYSILAALPRDLGLTTYEVWVHNGSGGPVGWGGGARLRVSQPARWPDQIFNARDFGARGDNVTDDSEAFRRALAAAEHAGGGVVYLPAGTYRVSGWFRLPRRVIVRGEGREISWLKWPQITPRSVSEFIPAVLYGTGEYGLEHLSLMVRNARTVLRDLSFDSLLGALESPRAPIAELEPFMRPVGDTRDVFLRDVRVHYVPWAGRPSAEATRDPQWLFDRWGITTSPDQALALALGVAKNVEVSDCEFIGTQRFLDLDHARLTGNHFSNQMGVSWTDVGGQYIVFEGNQITGVSSWRSALAPVRHLYIAHNVSRNIERGEREALSFDVNVVLGRRERSHRLDAWQGGVTSASADTVRLRGAAFQLDSYRGFDVLILTGRGAGQSRSVGGNSSDTLTLAQPWDVPPDGTSLVLLSRLPGHVIFYRNVAEDASVLGEVWGTLYDAVFDGNEVKRSQGMRGLGGWFVQWLNNRLEVAVSYHAGTGPRGGSPEGGAEYGYVGFTVAGEMTNLPTRFEYVRAIVVRGNRLSYGHRILVMWGYGGERRRVTFVAARDVVIDHNQLEHAPVGIELDPNVEGAVVTGNRFNDVKEPLRLYAPERVLVRDAP